jgi:hypothetical protein
LFEQTLGLEVRTLGLEPVLWEVVEKPVETGVDPQHLSDPEWKLLLED